MFACSRAQYNLQQLACPPRPHAAQGAYLYTNVFVRWLAQDPNAPRTRATASPRAPLGDIRSPHSSDRPLSPTAQPLGSSVGRAPLLHGGSGQHSSPKAAAAAALSSTAVHQMLNRQAPILQQHRPHQQHHSTASARGADSYKQQKPAGATAAAAVDEAALVDSLLKYNYYKQVGVDPRHVAPYREEWLEASLALVPRTPAVSQVCSRNSSNMLATSRPGCAAGLMDVNTLSEGCTGTRPQCHRLLTTEQHIQLLAMHDCSVVLALSKCRSTMSSSLPLLQRRHGRITRRP